MSTKKAPEGAQVQEEYTPYSLESQIKELIKANKPTGLMELAQLTNTDYRTVKLAIAVLRGNGELIMTSDKGGYCYADTEEQYRQWQSGIGAKLERLLRGEWD